MFLQYIISIASDIIIIISTIILIVALGITNTIDNKKIIISIILNFILSTFIFFTYPLKINFVSVFIYPLMYLFSYKIIFSKIKFIQIYIAFLLEFITYLLSSPITFVFMTMSSNNYNFLNIVSLFISRILIFLLVIIINKNSYSKQLYPILKTVPKYIWVLILLVLIFISSISDLIYFPTTNSAKQLVITLFIVLLIICLTTIIISLLINVASKNYYTALNSLLEKQVEAQITHYEKLEELNKDIRQLRHDYINHLTSIGTLIEHKNYPDALQYIERLTESTHCNETIFSTGNHLADAILTGKSNECKEFADIEFNGIITDRINNIDMCAILANALDNAIEACRKCSGRSKISIAAQNKQGYWVMTMRNPTIGEDSEGLMKTSKEDTQNHGFGLLSIEQAVKRYDGNIKVGIKDGIFEISIVVKD